MTLRVVLAIVTLCAWLYLVAAPNLARSVAGGPLALLAMAGA